MDTKHLFDEYLEARDKERMLRRELSRVVADDPVEAYKAGLIRLTFNFPASSQHRAQFIESFEGILGLR